VEIRYTTARAAFFTGCAILAVSARAYADIAYPNDPYSVVLSQDIPATPLSGTLGNGFGYRLPLRDTTDLRIETHSLGTRQNINGDFYKYRLNTRLKSRSLIFDWRPFGGAFHTNIGIFVNDYVATGSGETAGRFAFSDLFADTSSFREITQQDLDSRVRR
jgi:hypothetical protein